MDEFDCNLRVTNQSRWAASPICHAGEPLNKKQSPTELWASILLYQPIMSVTQASSIIQNAERRSWRETDWTSKRGAWANIHPKGHPVNLKEEQSCGGDKKQSTTAPTPFQQFGQKNVYIHHIAWFSSNTEDVFFFLAFDIFKWLFKPIDKEKAKKSRSCKSHKRGLFSPPSLRWG